MDLSQCKDVCRECHQMCIEAATHYLVKGEGELRDHVRLLWDCSEICIITANFLGRGSEYRGEACRACAIVCDGCAERCGRMADPIMKRCGEICRLASNLCRQVAAG